MIKIYASLKIHLKHLPQEDISQLHILKREFSKLYNCCVKALNTEYSISQRILGVSELHHKMCQHPQAKALGKPYMYAANIALQNYRSSIYNHMKTPNFYSLNHSITLKGGHLNGVINLPATSKTTAISIPLPEIYHSLKIQMLHIKYQHGEWNLIITYEKTPKTAAKKKINSVGVDMGVENLLAVACSNGNTAIIDGRYLKFLCYKLRFSEEKKAERIKRQMDGYLNKAAKILVDFCAANDAAEMYMGNALIYNGALYNMYKEIPFSLLYRKIEFKCREYGIKFYCVPEAYTSKASFIDGDFVPMTHYRTKSVFSGSRIKRGLYRTKDGLLINADINGALNILAKYDEYRLQPLQQNPALIKQPSRIKIIT